ncbi:activator-dependent family glycosyltransferase [Allonocardiopsis opalescens]|uniref:Glycosyltransferase DesVII/glycosyltransferase OleGII n=1 Tax=Allonocardiopsis opalescens TaxID=1144618 RepID=A0A2T0QCW2_9ACTN|nr:activator-dependent family glycosyltransferase [Allonocardiopsis opalescens]PRY01745.1 glycosyltransferase DesVII/glycosyltransferase OleGII [Allonocardiopsis opalescens]
MRVLVTSFAHSSHFGCMVPPAWALRAAGHEVQVLSQPALTAAVTGAGLTAVPVGTDDFLAIAEAQMQGGAALPPEARLYGATPDEATWEGALGLENIMIAFPTLFNDDRFIDDVVSYARQWRPDLVLWEPWTPAGAVAARVTGAAHARMLWSLDFLGMARQTFTTLRDRQPEAHREDPLAEWLTWTVERYGGDFDEELVTGQWTISTMPPSLRLPVDLPVLDMRYIPYNGAAVVPDWLREPAKRPRVCLTLGETGRTTLPGDSFSPPLLVEALADLDIELIATLDESQRGSLERVPDNTRIVDFVPLHALLPSCSLVISHAGAGSFNTALYNGVPQLLIADLLDAPLKARGLAERGAGLAFHPEGLDVEQVRAGVVRMLAESSFTEEAARLREELHALPTPAQLVPELERLVERHRGRSADRGE